MDKNYLKLKSFAEGRGIELFGVADIAGVKGKFNISKSLTDKVDKAVCLGMRLSSSILEELSSQPSRLYLHHYRTVNSSLDQVALEISNMIQRDGFCSIPIPASVVVDWEKQTAHLSHRQVAVLAGLGWIGRNNLLVNGLLGSQFRLATVLTDLPLAKDAPVEDDCGSCRRCVNACPAQAIHDTPLEFDHNSCLEKLKSFQKQRMIDQYICGVCVNTCRGPKIG